MNADDQVVSAKTNPIARPTPAFDEFRRELNDASPTTGYDWNIWKERACDWIIDRIPSGKRVVDVGGTEYLCNKLAEKNCETTYYDFFPPENFPNYVVDDMFNVSEHFDQKTIDVITTRHTLEHSLAPLFQLWSYNRLLKDDGQLIVVVPTYNQRWVWFRTHYNCLPLESWHMLFYRAGFDVVDSDAGSWRAGAPDSIEHRFVLSIGSRKLRLENRKSAPWNELSSKKKIIYRPSKEQIIKVRSDERERLAQRSKLRRAKLRKWWRPTNWKSYVKFFIGK